MRDKKYPAGPGSPVVDPFPDRIEPCLALLARTPPKGPDWIFEVKWDGYRLALHKNDDAISIRTRGGHDWTHRFPALAHALQKLDVRSVVLDGEAVVLDADGRSDFNALQRALGGRGGKTVTGGDVMLYAFDLLYCDGHDLSKLPLEERRDILKSVVEIGVGSIRLSEEVEADGDVFFKVACDMNLEGIIAKRRGSRYRSGRKGDWLKIKCIQRETFLIIGYEVSSKTRGAIANLLLAARQNEKLIYIGSVGTGFTANQAVALKTHLDQMRVAKPVVSLRRKGVVWTRPKLACEIEFRAWTDDGKLRHASFKGLRDPDDHIEVFSLDRDR